MIASLLGKSGMVVRSYVSYRTKRYVCWSKRKFTHGSSSDTLMAVGRKSPEKMTVSAALDAIVCRPIPTPNRGLSHERNP